MCLLRDLRRLSRHGSRRDYTKREATAAAAAAATTYRGASQHTDAHRVEVFKLKFRQPCIWMERQVTHSFGVRTFESGLFHNHFPLKHRIYAHSGARQQHCLLTLIIITRRSECERTYSDGCAGVGSTADRELVFASTATGLGSGECILVNETRNAWGAFNKR